MSSMTWKNWLALFVCLVITCGLMVGGNVYLFPDLNNIFRYILIALVFAIGVTFTYHLMLKSRVDLDNYRILGLTILFPLVFSGISLVVSGLVIYGVAGLFISVVDLLLGGIGGLFFSFVSLIMYRPMLIVMRSKR